MIIKEFPTKIIIIIIQWLSQHQQTQMIIKEFPSKIIIIIIQWLSQHQQTQMIIKVWIQPRIITLPRKITKRKLEQFKIKREKLSIFRFSLVSSKQKNILYLNLKFIKTIFFFLNR